MRTALIARLAILSTLSVIPTVAASDGATFANQVRFIISPGANDPIWKSPGIKFEKAADCQIIRPDAKNPLTPEPGEILSSGTATAPAFNPGQPQPDGSYGSAPDDGFNTLFVRLAAIQMPKAYIACRARILANGTNIVAPGRDGRVAVRVETIGASGPITLRPQISPGALRPPITTVPLSKGR